MKDTIKKLAQSILLCLDRHAGKFDIVAVVWKDPSDIKDEMKTLSFKHEAETLQQEEASRGCEPDCGSDGALNSGRSDSRREKRAAAEQGTLSLQPSSLIFQHSNPNTQP